MFFTLLLLCIFVSDSLSNKTSRLEGRVYKGYDVGIHQYSYAVFLYFETTKPSSCGASLIMVQAVITAAHCVDELRYRRGQMHAYLGSTVPNDSNVVRRATDYIIHPRYDEKRGKGDIAVVFLDVKVPLRHEIKKVPLAAEDPGVNVLTAAAAWGKQTYGKLPDFSRRRSMKATKQQIIPNQECAKYSGMSVSPKMLCTKPLIGHFTTDDAGSGLVLTKPSHILVGVLSYVADDIAHYTNVYAERNWIIKSCFDLYGRNCPGKNFLRRKVPFV